MDDGGEFLGDGRIGALALFGDFIADAPEHNAGMVAVAADQRAQILFVPEIEQVAAAVIIAPLVLPPGIEGFVQDQETHLIGQVQQFRRGRIVAGADGVAAHVAQHFKLPL